jgi:type II secretory pathway pseudopilin PulG
MLRRTKTKLSESKYQDGYMLMEALIAIAVFSIGFLAVATLVMSSTRNNRSGNMLTQANMLARQRLEQLKNTPDIATLPQGPVTNTETDIDATGNPGGIYTRATKIEDILGFNTSRQIEVTVSWPWQGTSRSIVLNTLTKGNGT